MSRDFDESGPMPLQPARPSSTSQGLLDTVYRLERKVDKLSETLGKLLVFEERQSAQQVKLQDLEKEFSLLQTRNELLEKKVDQWINRGIGVWAVAGVIFALYKVISGH